MVYGLISDIHANLEALEAVLAELSGVDAFLCLGDIVGYGPDPEACLARVRGLRPLTCVVGNHDLAAVGDYDLNWFNPYARAAVRWTAERLSADDRAFLAALPDRAEVAGAALAHGSFPHAMEYVTDTLEARAALEAMPRDLGLIGHTHVAEAYRMRAGSRLCAQVPFHSGGEVKLEEGLRQLINPGSVGQPRDGNPLASFGRYDTEARRVEVCRAPYDVEAVQRKMRRAGLPAPLIERLSVGR